MGRALVVNNTLQTVMDLSDPSYNFWDYTSYISRFTEAYPAGSRVLLLGMGGGTLVRRLQEKGLDLEVVEIDARIAEVAHRYFGMDSEVPIHIDDARHFIKVAKHNYDIIIFDVFKGETAPEHVLTLEGLKDAERVLSPGGIILVNFYGFLEGDMGMLTRSFYKTFLRAGFLVDLFATPGPPDARNVILVGRRKGEADVLSPSKYEGIVPLTEVDTSRAVVMTDERPRLRLFARAAMQWRRLYNDFFDQLESR